MRKISFKLRNIGSEKYLSYLLDDECEFDEELLDYLEDNKIPELLDIIYEEDDENDYLTYNVTGRTTVGKLLSDTVNAEKILGIIRGVASGIVNLRDLGIPASYVVLHKEFTYVNPVTYAVGMLCVPIEQEANINAEFKLFVKDILTSVTYDDNEDCNYVAKLLNLINVDKFTVRSFYSQLTEMMESAGMAVEDSFVDLDSDVSVSQTGSTPASDTSMDDLPEYEDVSFGSDDEDEDDEDIEVDEGDDVVSNLFKDLAAGDGKAGENVDMSVFDDSVLEELEIDEEEPAEEPEIDAVDNAEESEDNQNAEESETCVAAPESEAEPEASQKGASMTELLKTAEGVTEVAIEGAGAEEQKPVLLSTTELVEEPPVMKNIKVSRARIIQKAAAEAEDTHIDNPTEQIIAPEFGGGVYKEPETNMDPVTPKPPEPETERTGTTVELTAGMNVVKDLEAEKATANKAVPKAMPYMVRVNTNERVMVNKAVFKIGKASRGVDYHVGGNGAISKVHVIIYQREDGCYLKDNKATNGTYLNGTRLDENEEKRLSNDVTITIGGEDFIFKLS